MGAGYLRRSINYAFSRYEPDKYPVCCLCGKHRMPVTIRDHDRDRVWYICLTCAREQVAEHGEGCRQIIADLCYERGKTCRTCGSYLGYLREDREMGHCCDRRNNVKPALEEIHLRVVATGTCPLWKEK